MLQIGIHVHDCSLLIEVHNKVRQSLDTSQAANQGRAYPCFCSIKRLGVFLLPLNGVIAHHRVIINFTGTTHIYTWVKRGTVRVKCYFYFLFIFFFDCFFFFYNYLLQTTHTDKTTLHDYLNCATITTLHYTAKTTCGNCTYIAVILLN